MKRLMRASLAAAVAVMCGTVARATGTTAMLNEPCDLETLQGTYVFNASGFAVNGGVIAPKAIVEVLEFSDGLIKTPSLTLNVNGTTIRSRPGADGVYTLADDCTGSVTFADAGHAAFDIVVSHQGERIWMIQTNPAAVFQGMARRVTSAPSEE
jgi:hypothetical protein